MYKKKKNLSLQDGLPLHCNFIPLDIRLQNWEELPPEFNRTENRRQVCASKTVKFHTIFCAFLFVYNKPEILYVEEK